MFEYPVPFNNELLEYKPYRTNSKLERIVTNLYSHPSLNKANRQLFNDIRTSGLRLLVRDMCNIALAITLYYIKHPQQYGHSLENILDTILVRMWRQIFYHTKLQSFKPEQYHGTQVKLLSKNENILDVLIQTALSNDYIASNDDVVKKRTTISSLTGKTVGLRDRVSYGTHEGGDTFEYLASLE